VIFTKIYILFTQANVSFFLKKIIFLKKNCLRRSFFTKNLACGAYSQNNLACGTEPADACKPTPLAE